MENLERKKESDAFKFKCTFIFQRLSERERLEESSVGKIPPFRAFIFRKKNSAIPPTSSYNIESVERGIRRVGGMCFVPFFSDWTYAFSSRCRRETTTLNQNRWPARDSGLRKHRRDMGQENIAKSCLGGWRLRAFHGGCLKRNMLPAGRRLINLSYCASV